MATKSTSKPASKPTLKSVVSGAVAKYGANAQQKIQEAKAQVKPQPLSVNTQTSTSASSIKPQTSQVSTPTQPATNPFAHAVSGLKQATQMGTAQVKPVTTQKLQPQITPQIKPQPTQGYQFGDVQSLGSTAGQTKAGVSLGGTGKVLTREEVTKAPVLAKGMEFDKFGKTAEIQDQATPGFLEQRNNLYAIDIAKGGDVSGPAIERYLQGRGDFASASREDQLNTIMSIKKRLGEFEIPQQAQIQKPMTTEEYIKGLPGYQKDLDALTKDYEAQKTNFLKAGAVEDRFTNFNEINDRTNNILKLGGEDRASKGYQGMPSDKDIQDIATKAGVSFDVAKKTLEGRGYEDLQLQAEFREKAGQQFDRQLEDLDINRQRSLEDADTAHKRTMEALSNQIDDVMKQMGRDQDVGAFVGAATGKYRGSGYVKGTENIKNDAMTIIDRLKVNQDQDTTDTAQYKTRLLDDYNMNITRTKQDLDNQLNNLKTKLGYDFNTMLSEISPSENAFADNLAKMEEAFINGKEGLFNTHLERMNLLNQAKYGEVETLQKIMANQQQLQQNNLSNLTANNGAALYSTSKENLVSMVQSGEISRSQYDNMVNTQKTLAFNTLMGMGTPTQQEVDQMNMQIDSGLTPQQAINQIALNNPDRFINPVEFERKMQVNQEARLQEQLRMQQQSQQFNQEMDIAKFKVSKESVNQGKRLKLTDPNTGQEYYQNTDTGEKMGGTAQEQQTQDFWTRNATNTKSLNKEGDFDFDVEMGEQIPSPVSGKIVAVNQNTPGTNDGNIQIQIKSDDGKTVTINHLDPSTVDIASQLVGQNIDRGTIIGISGNSGNVQDINGNRLRKDGQVFNQQALDSGTGSHVDVRVAGLKGNEARDYFMKYGTQSNEALDKVLNNAVMGLSKDARAQVNMYVNNAIKQGNVPEAKALIENALANSLKGDEASKFAFYGNGLDSVVNMKNAREAYKKAGGDTGLFEGKVEELAGKVGKIKDPQLRTLGNQLQMALQSYRSAISGAAFSTQEAAEYEALFPSMTDSVDLNNAKIDALMNSIQGNKSLFMKRKLGPSYEKIFGSYNYGQQTTQQDQQTTPNTTTTATQGRASRAKYSRASK